MAESGVRVRDVGDSARLDIPALVASFDEVLVAIPEAQVLEIVRLDGATTDALVADHAPVLHLRGQVIPIVPLRWMCGVPDPVERPRCVVLVQDGGATFGIVLEAVSHIEEVPAAPLDPSTRELFAWARVTTLGDGREALLVDVACLAIRAGRWIDVSEPDDRERAPSALDAHGAPRVLVFRSAEGPRRAAS